MFIPNVFYKKDGFKDQSADLFSRLLNLGCIFITGPIDDNTATLFLAAAQHIVMDLKLSKVTVYINSPGGQLYSGLAIVDIIRFGFSNVQFNTKCVGLAASAASIILAAGHHRSMSAHSRVMIHQPLGGVKGQATDIHIYAEQLNIEKKLLVKLYTMFSAGKADAEYFKQHMERDTFLRSHEALKVGLIDHIFGESLEFESHDGGEIKGLSN